ncbi:acetolactate synthase large subunit [Salibacterium halotolerans]|uniref:Acetolactate synthase-1/2/3 large subunit n=1 Tax=Salibacterium halotolerans TaxID=1884432 RepID=A0A1I5TCL2_9BACI|nr:acetolactate synthase large subunit [Salibacterium halotolerans]SFP80782.1 acetolactate synthase-1/2/3 large subunit [Salibacterium halotolerans]
MGVLNTAELLITCLENEGIEYMFGVPGEENIDLMDALIDSRIEFIVTRHETGAAFMAGTYGRLTGKPAACLATLGPGATNLMTGVANANMDNSPLIAITGQAGLNRHHKISHQHYDLVSMYKPVTKWNTQIKSADTVPEIVQKAVEQSTREKPGAVHIDLPEDVAGMEAAGSPLPVRSTAKVKASEQNMNKALEIINRADHPLILAGNGIARAGAAKELLELVEKQHIPVVQTFMGKGALPRDHERNLLTAGLSGNDYITCGFREADLIITAGFDMAEYPPQNWNPDGRTPILHVDSKEAEVDAYYPPAVQITGCIRTNLTALTQSLPSQTRDIEWVKNVRTQALQELSSFQESEGFPVKPQKIIADLRDVLNEEDIVISDVGAHKMWMARMYHTSHPNTCLISNGLASMGIAVPGAAAAKMVHPERTVVAVCGDGGFQMTGAELETAVRMNLPVIILLWRDNGYGLIEWHQKRYFERTSHISFGNPDFTELARAYGLKAYGISHAKELKPVMEEAVSLQKPVLIDCPVDYSENMKLTEKLGNILC